MCVQHIHLVARRQTKRFRQTLRVATLLDEAVRHALANWHTWGRAFEGILFIKRGDAVNGLALLRTAQGELRETGFAALYTEILRALAEALAGAGEVAEGLVTIDEALARSERNEERWCVVPSSRENVTALVHVLSHCCGAPAERCKVQFLTKKSVFEILVMCHQD